MIMEPETARALTREEYLRRIGFWLRDLPWSVRRDLLAEIRGSLAELPAGTDLRARLGTAEEYAAELRAAAGLERRRGPLAFLRARRPRNLILTVFAVVLIALAIGLVEFVDGYQPLVAAGSMANPAGVKQDNVGGVESVDFHQGAAFRFGIDVTNSGSHTVRVLGAAYGAGYPFRARLVISGPSHGGTVLPLTPFRPFDLPPGQTRLFIFKGRFHYRCPQGMNDGTTIMSLNDLPVRYRFLWRTATAEVPLPEQLKIVFRKGSCAKP